MPQGALPSGAANKLCLKVQLSPEPLLPQPDRVVRGEGGTGGDEGGWGSTKNERVQMITLAGYRERGGSTVNRGICVRQMYAGLQVQTVCRS